MLSAEDSLADNTKKPKRTETKDHIIYKNVPINTVLSDLAKLAGAQNFHNTLLDNKDEYLVNGHITKSADGVEAYNEIAFQYGLTGFQRGKTFYSMTQEQLAKFSRDKFLWKVRYIKKKDIPNVTAQLRKAFTAIDSRVDYLPDRNTFRIQGRFYEVEKVEKLLDELDSENGAKKLSEKKVVERDAPVKP